MERFPVRESAFPVRESAFPFRSAAAMLIPALTGTPSDRLR
jgi:hypothetical protein